MPSADLQIALYSGLLLALSILAYLFLRHKYLGPKDKLPQNNLSQYLYVDEFKLHYIEQGKGPNVLLLHGIGASTYSWRMIFEQLSLNYHTIALDLPGFGLSSKLLKKDYGLDQQAKRILEFVNNKSLDQTYLIGSSMGGTLALWLNLLEPNRFPRIVAIAPATNPKIVPFKIENFVRLAPSFRLGLNNSAMKLILQRIFANHHTITAEVIRNYLIPYKNEPNGVETFMKATKLLLDSRLPIRFREITSPVLILWGRKDKIVQSKYIEELRQCLNTHIYREHHSGGHHLMEDDPVWTLGEVLSFFRHPDNHF